MQIFNKLFWNPNLGDDHSFQLMVGTYTQDKTEKGYGSLVANTASTSLTDPTNDGRLTNGIGSLSSSTQQYRKVSVYSMAHYALKDRYIIDAVIRRDGSSKYGAGNRWGNYPSLSGRYRLSCEPVIAEKTEDWLDDLSIRARWGVNVVEPIGNYPSVATYNVYNYRYLCNQATFQVCL